MYPKLLLFINLFLITVLGSFATYLAVKYLEDTLLMIVVVSLVGLPVGLLTGYAIKQFALIDKTN